MKNGVFQCDRNPKGATQRASRNLKKNHSEFEKETSETLFIQKNRSVFWPGNFLEDCLSQYRVDDFAKESCLSHR